MSEEITVHIKYVGEKKHQITISPTSTVAELKTKVSEATGVEPDLQRLIYSGKVLKDPETLGFYKVQDGHSIHMVKSSAAKKQSASGSGGSASSGVPANIAAGTHANDPLAGLTDARYAGYGAQLPSTAGMFGPDGMPNEEQMSQAMNNPMFRESMNMMLDNPAMLDSIIAQHPVLRNMGPQARDIMRSPMFRQMMSNPDMMRSAMEAQRSMGGAMGGLGDFGGFGAAAGGAPATHESSNTNNNASSQASNPFAALFPGAGGSAGGLPPFDPSLMSSLLQGMGAPAADSAPATSTRPPEEVYEHQLRQLNDMGFTDFDRNVSALRRSGGSVQGAIDNLLNGSV